MLLQLPHFPNVTEVAIHLEETALRAAFSRKTRPPLVLYLPSYFSTVNLLIKRPFFCVINRSRTFFPSSITRARFTFENLSSEGSSTDSGRLLSALFVLDLHKNGRTYSRPQEWPFIEWLSEPLRIKTPLRFLGRVATVIFIAISRGCEGLRRAGNDIARRRKFLVDFSTIVQQLRTIDTRYAAQI